MGVGAGREMLQRDMFWANGRVRYLDHMVVSRVYTDIKMHQIVRFDYVQLIVGQLYLHKSC